MSDPHTPVVKSRSANAVVIAVVVMLVVVAAAAFSRLGHTHVTGSGVRTAAVPPQTAIMPQQPNLSTSMAPGTTSATTVAPPKEVPQGSGAPSNSQ